MKWAGSNEPICVGTNRKKTLSAALKIMKEEHGMGPVDRGAAFCSAPITYDDIDISTIKVIA